MKVLMLARSNLFTDPGGDTVQVQCTAHELRQLGCTVDINPIPARYDRYGIVHFFNLITPQVILRHIPKLHCPFVVSPIYVRYGEYEGLHRGGALGLLNRTLPPDGIEYVKTVGKWVLRKGPPGNIHYLLRGHWRSMRLIMEKAACLLPNSTSEYRRLQADFGIEKPYVVVPNGVDAGRFKPPTVRERAGVLCVGRIEGRKNILNLIRAINPTGLPLYLIGAPAVNQPRYKAACRREAGRNVHFLGPLPQEELVAHYARARVHALPSWFETTGLVSLEAAICGCNLVVGDRGDVRDYFQNDAWYCEPGDPVSIQAAIEKAYQAPPGNRRLVARIKTEYTWQRAAAHTMAAYEQALKNASS